MRIDHIALYVKDLERTREFFQSYFQARSNNGYRNPKSGLRTYFLTFEDGTRLEIMTRSDLEDPEKSEFRTGYIHLAFSLGSSEAVDSITKRLADDGFTVLSGPRTTGDGYYESCVLGPEGNILELTV
ncbi:MAG: VOC family protein [Planctomycetia bacterium]|nr:VOC family protein [Planctomycetia bacterium]